MKYLPLVVGALLGLLFVASGAAVLLRLAPLPPLPEGSPAAHFMAAFVPTGYLTFVKVLEIAGGLLVAVPRTRALGLLTLGPIIVNILAYHAFVLRGEGLFQAPIVLLTAFSLYLLWVERRAFGALLPGPRPGSAAN
jgi:putative oxidoreductase